MVEHQFHAIEHLWDFTKQWCRELVKNAAWVSALSPLAKLCSLRA